jgi:hypothetical protein
VTVLAVMLATAACGSPRAARALPATTTSTTAVTPTTGAPTTTLPSAVPTTVPTPVVAAAGWSHPATTLPPVGGFTGVSCISGVFCVAVGGGANEADVSDSSGPGVVAAWDGATWGAPSDYFAAPSGGPVVAPELAAISCTSGPLCAVVDGSGHTSVGNGTTWSPPAPLAGAPGPAASPADPGPDHEGARSAAVSCPSGQFCAYVDNTGHVAVMDGTTWSASRTFTDGSVELFQPGRVGVSCATPSFCTALVGDTALAWDGATWSAAAAPWAPDTTGDSAVSCPAVGTCVAVRGGDVSVETAGSGWSTPRPIDAGGRLDAVSCPTADFCLAADTYGDVVTWHGSTWSAPVKVVPTPEEYPGDGTSLACPSDQYCMVLTGDGDYAAYQGDDPTAAVTTASPVG